MKNLPPVETETLLDHFERLQLPVKLLIRQRGISESCESPHDKNAHFGGTSALENHRQHDGAMLREREGRLARIACFWVP